MKMFIQ